MSLPLPGIEHSQIPESGMGVETSFALATTQEGKTNVRRSEGNKEGLNHEDTTANHVHLRVGAVSAGVEWLQGRAGEGLQLDHLLRWRR